MAFPMQRPWQHLADAYFSGSQTVLRSANYYDAAQEKYDRLSDLTDTISDDLGRAIIEKRVQRTDFDKALELGLEAVPNAPPELVAFMASATYIPPSIDMAAVERGGAVFRSIPAITSVVHSVVSAFIFASIYPNSAISLSLNKNLITATQRRYIESYKYMADTVAPHGLSRFSKGFKSACRVRLVHGFVRSEIARHFDWNYEAYRKPINQAGVLQTAMVSGSYMIPYAASMGSRLTAQEQSDLCMHAAYLALLQGVPPEFIPTSVEEGSDFTYNYLLNADLPLAEDRDKAMSVLQPLTEKGFPVSPSKMITTIFNGYILEEVWRLFGDELCRSVNMPRYALAKFYAPLMRTATRLFAMTKSIAPLRARYLDINARFWSEKVPAMLTYITGHADVAFTETAKVK